MNIIITGGSRGIGMDAALDFCRTSEHRVLVIARSETKLRELETGIRKINPDARFRYCVADLTDAHSPALTEALAGWNTVDVLINNAGQLVSKPFEQLSDEDWHTMININLMAPVRITRMLLDQLQASDHAHIVNISSMGGFQGSSKFPGLSAYSAAKAALANLTECLAEELKDRNIAVNCLSLGSVQTEMLAKAFPGYRAPVSSHSMGAFLAWFALNGHRFFNGKNLPVSITTP